jgi:hypothetical protein
MKKLLGEATGLHRLYLALGAFTGSDFGRFAENLPKPPRAATISRTAGPHGEFSDVNENAATVYLLRSLSPATDFRGGDF